MRDIFGKISGLQAAAFHVCLADMNNLINPELILNEVVKE